MSIEIRPMRPEESRDVQRTARRAFSIFEGLWITRPKQALVAVENDRVLGAILYKIFSSGGQQVGYYDYAFVDPAAQGRGVGGALYAAAAKFLWEQGCDALTAAVKDDNAASWRLFEKNGFVRASLPSLARRFGLGGALRHCWETPLLFAVGMDYYVAVRDGRFDGGKGGTAKQLAAYLAANLLLLLPMALLAGGSGLWRTLGALAALVLCAGAEAVGTLFSRQRGWSFRTLNGGAALHAFFMLYGVFPMMGKWHPARYARDAAFRRDMGLAAACGWLALLACFALCARLLPPHPLVAALGRSCAALLVYYLFPFYPFESAGGGRVWRWSRAAFGTLAVLTLAALFLLP